MLVHSGGVASQVADVLKETTSKRQGGRRDSHNEKIIFKHRSNGDLAGHVR